ncbi:MFS transporter [Corynebacterium glaucum]|uniref:MFS transporter n=1 Tax=Corynebacterium glaucum TaxID=187491 RepID=UPI0025B46F95|nr:MFS transporter [Corynebacterium glaucum]
MRGRGLQAKMVYVGGFVGPFAAQSMIAVIPDIGATFGKTVQEAAFAVSAYMIPFATTMLFSTALVRKLPPHLVVRSAYVATALGSLVCFTASSWPVFITGIVIMSLSNAFTLPVLQVILREIIPPDELGQALGTYFAMQSLGNCAAPLVAGLASIANWQFMYLAVMAISLAMVIVGVPPVNPVPKEQTRRRAAIRPMIVHILTILAVGMGIIGMGAVLTVHLEGVFGMPASSRGFVIMVGGLAAFFVARKIGALVDDYGALRILTMTAIAAAVSIGVMPILPSPIVIAVFWAVAFVAAQGMQTTVTYSVLRMPGGASFNSTVLAFRFFGLALTPILILPIYFKSPVAGFALPAACLLAALGLQWTQRRQWQQLT